MRRDVDALLQQCEAVKVQAQAQAARVGLSEADLASAKQQNASSPVLRQLRHSSQLDKIMTSVTAAVEQQAREIEQKAQGVGLKKAWGRGSSHTEGARLHSQSQALSPERFINPLRTCLASFPC